MGKIFLAFLFTLVLASKCLADDGTDPNAVLAQLASYSPGQLLHFGVSAALGGLLSLPGQAMLEHLFACVPKLPALVKSFGPSLLGWAGAYVGMRYLGVSPASAGVAWTTFVGVTHLVNQSNLAVVSPNGPTKP